ncbi:SET domain-containing protein 5 [Actinomortierella ambigua]|uniref:Histone-lysine N-methyltransferase SET5 n=1 Tax=Actinomortierella ambigua TaxID=1343610 RepID=A0A9P6UA06_9FUNG|nr:SET domain-containing protein 5 [Actinomortierella ambigua]
MASITPDAADLLALIKDVKQKDASLGVKKVLAEVQAQQPTWLVSEKRVKKLMSDAGLVQTKAEPEVDASVPVSHVDAAVDVHALTQGKLKVRMINRLVGKGMFANEDLPKDMNLFTEFPFVYFPPWKRMTMVRKGDACGLCARTLKNGSILVCGCPTCKRVRYCTKACRDTAWDSFHRFECAAINPHIKAYMDFCEGETWNAGMGALRCYERILIANEISPEELKRVLKHLDAFATVSQEERQKKETAWDMMGDQTYDMWKKALSLLVKACKYPVEGLPAAKNGGSPQAVTKPLPDDVANSIFTMDMYLKFLGRYNINNQDGGLYLLHSSLNHACVPNVVIDHPGAGTNYGVTVRTLRPIKKGEELYITYCDPRWGRETRQQYLKTEYLFGCKCKRCQGASDELGGELMEAIFRLV